MADLTRVERSTVLQAREIAERRGISKTFLGAIFADLRVSGLVFSRKGPEGGHMLTRPP